MLIICQAGLLKANSVATSGSGLAISTGSEPLKSAPATVPFFLTDQRQVASVPFLPSSDPFSVSLRILSSLFAVIILAFGLSWFLQKKGGFGKNVYGKVVGILPLDNRRLLYIVDVMGKILILGVTDQNINLLCEITDQNTINSLRLENDTPSLPGMEKIFSFLKKKKEVETPKESHDQTSLSESDIKKQTDRTQDRLKNLKDLLVQRDNREE